jgi:hypothetical protein
MKNYRALAILAMVPMLFWATTTLQAGSLPMRDYQGVKYVSGGVGQDERDYLNSVENQFNLQLMFAAEGGAFLSSVKVLIQDARGATVLDAVADGPYFYAALRPGTYTVTANLDGRSSQRKVTVGTGRATRADFRWK